MKNFKMIISVIATYLSWILGGWDMALKLLLIAIIVDYISGMISGYIKGELSSKVGLKGILKKVMYLMVVAVASIIDTTASSNGAIRELVIYYFISNECLSILENAAKAGLPVPNILSSKLKVMQGETTANIKVDTKTEIKKEEVVINNDNR